MPSPIGNFFVKTLLNSPLYPLLGRSFAMITVTGRKTGRAITTPINTIFIDDVLTVISMRERTWWRNLRNGRTALLRQAGRTFPMRAQVVETPAEIAAWMRKYFDIYPGYAKYFKVQLGSDGKPTLQELERLASERVVIRLSPITEGESHH